MPVFATGPPLSHLSKSLLRRSGSSSALSRGRPGNQNRRWNRKTTTLRGPPTSSTRGTRTTDDLTHKQTKTMCKTVFIWWSNLFVPRNILLLQMWIAGIFHRWRRFDALQYLTKTNFALEIQQHFYQWKLCFIKITAAVICSLDFLSKAFLVFQTKNVSGVENDSKSWPECNIICSQKLSQMINAWSAASCLGKTKAEINPRHGLDKPDWFILSAGFEFYQIVLQTW